MTDRPFRFNRRASLRGRSQTLGSSDHLTGNGINSRSSSRNSSYQNFFPPEDMNDLEAGRSSSFIQNGNVRVLVVLVIPQKDFKCTFQLECFCFLKKCQSHPYSHCNSCLLGWIFVHLFFWDPAGVPYFKRGKLTRMEESSYVVDWLDRAEGVEILTKISEDGRGMELSDLCRFQNRTLAPDDRTGIIYEIVNPLGGINGITGAPYAATRYVLPDGNGNEVKGFKGEWMTVKDGFLYVGSHGRERTDAKNGTHIESYNPMWIKRIDSRGNIEHIDWSENYNAVRKAVGASFPGYLENEAVLWSSRRRSWIFLPRRWSLEPYDDEKNEFREEKGFSSARFVPGSKETLICALRTIEHEEKKAYATYMTIFSIESGNVVLPDTLIGNQKYEGIEFLAESL
ncbi:Apyrase [Galdieria sulphuraria]|nr:Apyrase [Galdieria sulphuraria]